MVNLSFCRNAHSKDSIIMESPLPPPRKWLVLINFMLTIQYVSTYKMSTHYVEGRETITSCDLPPWCVEENKTTMKKFLQPTSFPLDYGNEVRHFFQFYKCYPYWIPLVVQLYSAKTNKQNKTNKNKSAIGGASTTEEMLFLIILEELYSL